MYSTEHVSYDIVFYNIVQLYSTKHLVQYVSYDKITMLNMSFYKDPHFYRIWAQFWAWSGISNYVIVYIQNVCILSKGITIYCQNATEAKKSFIIISCKWICIFFWSSFSQNVQKATNVTAEKHLVSRSKRGEVNVASIILLSYHLIVLIMIMIKSRIKINVF